MTIRDNLKLRLFYLYFDSYKINSRKDNDSHLNIFTQNLQVTEITIYKQTKSVIRKTYHGHSIIVWRFMLKGLTCTPVKRPIQLWIIAFTGALGIEYVPRLERLGLMIMINFINGCLPDI